MKAYTTVKKTKRAARIWVEGKKLIDHGFLPNTQYSINYTSDSIVLTVDNTGSRHVTGSYRDGKPRPIIDLHSMDVLALFNAGDRIQVDYSHNMIIFRKEA